MCQVCRKATAASPAPRARRTPQSHTHSQYIYLGKPLSRAWCSLQYSLLLAASFLSLFSYSMLSYLQAPWQYCCNSQSVRRYLLQALCRRLTPRPPQHAPPLGLPPLKPSRIKEGKLLLVLLLLTLHRVENSLCARVRDLLPYLLTYCPLNSDPSALLSPRMYGPSYCLTKYLIAYSLSMHHDV